jgi:hypothetical protein
VPTEPSKLDQNRLALAALTACFVQAIGEESPAVRERFEKNMEKPYYLLRESSEVNTGAMQTLNWARDFLKEL